MYIEIFPIAEADVVTLVKSINRVVINPVIFFLFAVAMVYFLYGVTRYFLSPDNTEVRDASKAQMIWGVTGLFIMVAVFGILQVIINTFGISNVKIQSNGDYSVNSISTTDGKTYTNGNVSSVSGGATTYDLNGKPTISTTTVSSSTPLVYSPIINGNPSTSPFSVNYTSSNLCWREAIAGNGATEYQAIQSVQNITRKDYLSATGQTDLKAPTKYPIIAERQTLYDADGKKFYVWFGVVAPIGKGTLSDCNILETLTPLSKKANPFTVQYADTATMYEIVTSGVDPILENAKSNAIENALIEIAKERGLTSTKGIPYAVLDGKYYPPDAGTKNYDYWVAIQSPK